MNKKEIHKKYCDDCLKFQLGACGGAQYYIPNLYKQPLCDKVRNELKELKMSKEKGCKCRKQIWCEDMLDKKWGLCPNCYEYCKPLIDDLKIKDKQIADLQHRLSNCIEPKFKIGQEVYFICDPNRIISGWKIADYEYYKQQYIIENKNSIDWIHKDRIFATKEEAEAKLQELQEK